MADSDSLCVVAISHKKDAGQKGELDSNFQPLLYLHDEVIEGLKEWMSKSQDKFTSPDIQNEILSIMALSVLHSISNEVAGSIMIDETTDNSNVEQMVFCLCYEDDNFDVHEEFIGLYSLESTAVSNILRVHCALLRMNLNIINRRGQCYDRAGNMAGIRSGLAAKIINLESRALYTHCYGHALNDMLKNIKNALALSDSVDCTSQVPYISGLYELSPLHQWTVQAKSLTSVDCTSQVPYISGLYKPSPLHQWTVRAKSLTSVDCTSQVPYISGLYEPSPLHQWAVRAKSLTSVDCTSQVPYISGLYEPSSLHQWTVQAKSLTSVDCTSQVPYISGLYEPSPLHQWTVRAKSLTSVDCTSQVPYISGLYEPSPLHQWTVRAKSLTSVDCMSQVPYISGLYKPSPLHQFRRTT
ncbi:hypothetical protein EMCRGX_G032237 [Ephydatia muelleri]